MRYALLFAAVFAVCYGGASLLTAQYSSLPAWDLPFEQHVPFVPALSVVYLTITPALLVALLRTHKSFAIALCVQTLLATFCFLLFPQTVAWTRPEVTGWARIPFSIADAMNLSYNQFPSLHVAFAVSAACALRKPLWWLWSIAVALSTWLMWEHHLVDIAGGIALALLVMPLVYPRVHVELQCLWQCAHFSRRHVRYFVIFLAIWLPSLLHWRRYRPVRLGFCAAQWIDDLLDGDRPSKREPLEIVDEILARRFGNDALSRLVAAFLEHLDEPAQNEFMDLVRCMRVDRVRVLHHERWTQAQLDAHHEATFRHSVNLMLITTGCTARASDVPSLIPALAWCSVVRDLDDDLRKGLVNIPRNADVAQWTRDSHSRACIALQNAAEEIAHLEDPRARRILTIFQRSITKYAARPLDSYPLLLSS
ncbi:MAG TPA: phosphatase PAP2 family protein [Thermoanaerobaculia bacterium]|nr:phosphatase PAP2 family protein [Thermoanaerobaculia bacterium]